MKKIIITLFCVLFLTSSYADMNDSDKNRAWECSGIYMANYFLPSGETFEYSMKAVSYTHLTLPTIYSV